MEVIDEILRLEWDAFQDVRNEGGRASCQDDYKTFTIMRVAQFLMWSEDMLESYRNDLFEAKRSGRNLMEEKYARMMESTAPSQYKAFADKLPPVSYEKKLLIDETVAIMLRWQGEYMRAYPKMASRSRPLRTSEDEPDDTSFETYLRGELATYSEATLRLFAEHNRRLLAHGVNAAIQSMEYTASMYGYQSLAEAEKLL
jgi:hypothetical protein